MRVIFYHGSEGSPNGPKVRALRKLFPDMETPDFQGMDYADRLVKADLELTGGEPAFLIGSSLGGRMAARMASMYPGHVKGMLLLAPAVYMDGEAVPFDHAPLFDVSRIVLAERDEYEGLNAGAFAYAAKFNLPLLSVNDGHRLEASLATVVALAKSLTDMIQVKDFWATKS